jgi:HSP20 family protein
MDRLLSGFAENLGHVAEGAWSLASRGQPAVNMWEDGEAVSVELEVPGLKGDQLEISVSGNELSLGIARPDDPQEGVRYHRRERPVGSFHRVVRLPVEVDASRVEADLKQGVLKIKLPKAEAARPRKITVAAVD